MRSTDAMATAMKNTTKSMVAMNRRLNLPQLQAIMRSFGIETERMEATQVRRHHCRTCTIRCVDRSVLCAIGFTFASCLLLLQEIMGDAIDDVLGDADEEEEGESIVQQVRSHGRVVVQCDQCAFCVRWCGT